MVTPYLKGNVAGPCPRCDGTGINDANKNGRCRACKGRGIIGKTAEEIVADMIAEREGGGKPKAFARAGRRANIRFTHSGG